MEKTAVQKLAGVLKILVTITFVCNLIVLPLVPVLVSVAGCQIPLPELLGNLTAEPPLPGDDWPYFSPGLQMFLVVVGAWTENFAFTFVLTLFLLFCGICTAVILWQGRRVLGTILTGAPFRAENGVSLRRAAVCCFLIAAAASSPLESFSVHTSISTRSGDVLSQYSSASAASAMAAMTLKSSMPSRLFLSASRTMV